MNEKYKNYFKKFGIAGFLFFLIKGILWLIFGSALYKWFKSLTILGGLCLVPFISFSQIMSEKSKYKNLKFEILQSSLNIQSFRGLEINKKEIPMFCRLENKLNPDHKQWFSFRLGSREYTDRLEYFIPSTSKL